MERCLRKFARAKKKEFYHKMNKTAKQYKKAGEKVPSPMSVGTVLFLPLWVRQSYH